MDSSLFNQVNVCRNTTGLSNPSVVMQPHRKSLDICYQSNDFDPIDLFHSNRSIATIDYRRPRARPRAPAAVEPSSPSVVASYMPL